MAEEEEREKNGETETINTVLIVPVVGNETWPCAFYALRSVRDDVNCGLVNRISYRPYVQITDHCSRVSL